MKYLFTTVMAMAIATVSFSQNVIQKEFSYLSEVEDITHVSISGKMFEMMMEIEGETAEEKQMIEAFSSIKGIEAYGSEKGENNGFHKEAIAKLGNRFEELITVEDNDVTATVYIDEKDGVVRELVAIGESKEGWGIASIWGEIDLKYVAQIARDFQINGLSEVEDERFEISAAISIFPNPSPANGKLQYEVPSDLLNGTYGVFDGSGKLMKSGQITSLKGNIDLRGLSKANYLVKFENADGEGFTKQFMVQ